MEQWYNGEWSWIPNPEFPGSNALGGSKVDSAFHPSKADQMSSTAIS